MNHDKTKGFTLIELMLAMSFIAVLLLAIALTIIQISAIYNRGLTIKDINQAGITITQDLQSSITNTSPYSIANPGQTGSHYIINKDGGHVTGGRLCLGNYSYIWNYGKYVALTDPSEVNTYTLGTSKEINLVKIVDPGANYCLFDNSQNPAYYYINPTNAVDLLDIGDHNLAIQSFLVSSPASSIDLATDQELYDIEFAIGTNNQVALQADSNGNMTQCSAPNIVGSDPTYCVVDTFDIVARAGNGVE
jgi:prepilin-type N-terminal cleavage/methylation domain-containing protein